MGAKEHYDNHLGNFYAWMVGDVFAMANDFQEFLNDRNIRSQHLDIAVDLGAGNGIQTIALARNGFKVIAIDFNKQLLNELTTHTQHDAVVVVNDNILNVRRHAHSAAVVTCCGDTITHLDSQADIEQLVADIYDVLKPGGKAVFSFRDYSGTLEGIQRFIPVKSDENRILTCVLDYLADSVVVTDLLYERIGGVWRQSVSSYQKIRVNRDTFVSTLERVGFAIEMNALANRLITVIAAR